MKTRLGAEFDEFMASFLRETPRSIRTNPVKKYNTTQLEKVPWSTFGFYINDRHSFTLDPVFHAGVYYPQEASSMFVESAVKQSVDLNLPLTILDLCAAPGGKSTHLISLLNRQSLLVSNEVIRSRATILKENMTKWGYPNNLICNNDPEHFIRLPNFFDLILVDAPCSGEGLFRKDSDAISQWSKDNVRLCSLRQQRIVANIWSSLKPGGTLIYSTCTFNEDENENNLFTLSKELNPEFLDLTINPEWGIEKVVQGPVIGYRFFPHKVRGEGFFISVLRKNVTDKSTSKMRSNKSSFNSAPPDVMKDWIIHPEENLYQQHGEKIIFIPSEIKSRIEIILQHLHVVSLGTKLGTVKKSKAIPDHALALSSEINLDAFNRLDLDTEQALNYLRKENILGTKSTTGIHLMVCHDNPLGWANILPNRINNLYPTDWRIRMR